MDPISIYFKIKNISKFISIIKNVSEKAISEMTISGNTAVIGNSEITVDKNSVTVNGNKFNLDSETGLPIGITPEDPNFINILKNLNLSTPEIQSILVSYYSGEPLKDILSRTIYIGLLAVTATTLIYPILISGPTLISLYSQLPKSELLGIYNEIIEINPEDPENEN